MHIDDSTGATFISLYFVRIGRYKEEDKCTLDLFVKHFGENIFKFMVIIFTHYDDWKRDLEMDRPDMNGFIKTLPSHLQIIIQNNCNDIIVGFDNTLKGPKSKQQVTELISIIDVMNKSNTEDGKEYYTSRFSKCVFDYTERSVNRET